MQFEVDVPVHNVTHVFYHRGNDEVYATFYIFNSRDGERYHVTKHYYTFPLATPGVPSNIDVSSHDATRSTLGHIEEDMEHQLSRRWESLLHAVHCIKVLNRIVTNDDIRSVIAKVLMSLPAAVLQDEECA